ncbi:hypothetical protein, partial [Salmonella sp. s51228]|uniref:hypothetical protein n=1 Tax=Salmonella sp. s51228 TaxID=3159652 RepID=UPI00397FC241
MELARLTKVAYHLKKAVDKQEYKKQKQLAKREALSGGEVVSKITPETNISVPFVEGALLKLEGLPDNSRREDVSALFKFDKDIAFIDFEIGLTEATIRFSSEGGAKIAVEKVKNDEGGIKFLEIDLKY